MVDVVERLLAVPSLPATALGAATIARIAREAADEIRRLRDESTRPEGVIDGPDWERHCFVRGGDPVRVSPSEWRVFEILARNGGKLVTLERIYDRICKDPDSGPDPKIIDIHVMRLRRKCPFPITTVWGAGYVLEGYRYRDPVPPPNAVAGLTRERLMAGR